MEELHLLKKHINFYKLSQDLVHKQEFNFKGKGINQSIEKLPI